jgi:hypothetical protein
MKRKIVLYGASKESFANSRDLQRYIENGVFAKDAGRFDYSQTKNADLIILSLDNVAYGHFEIRDKVRPTEKESRKYSPRVIYRVTKSTLYTKPVELKPIGIRANNFGKAISEKQFRRIQRLAGENHKILSIAIPEEVLNANYIEGSVVRIYVNAYERSPAARRECILHFGTRCQVCEQDLGEQYGKIAEGLIHVHHLKLLSEIGKQYKIDPKVDLRPVCPNCHAILHRTNPPMSIKSLRSRIASMKRRHLYAQ